MLLNLSFNDKINLNKRKSKNEAKYYNILDK